MAAFTFVVLLCTLLGISQAGFVDQIVPCSIKDEECIRKLYQFVLSSTTDNGIEELGIPPTDPFPLTNVSVTVVDMVTITMLQGEARGVKSCVLHTVRPDMEAKTFHMDFTCNMQIQGIYKVTSSPQVQNVIGGLVRGEGHGSVKIEKIHISADFPFFMRKGADGEIYADYPYEGMKFNFKFGKVRISADNLYINDQEMSKPIVKIFNDNWKFFLTTFGRPFVQIGMDFFFKYTHKWYDNVPMSKYIKEDMSVYL